ncbi:AsmA-like C-terminal region-containing protein, partial [Devosia sp.]|uniref:AsmA family protein n=1 Tax=Devosia sp. TaxID=1871048 RepID=UPI003A929B32
MLNRLYIIIGVLAILALAAAFVVPSFIPWSDYRDRMEAIAGEVLGTDVRIGGEIEFSLLPQPQLKLTDVSAGPVDAPNLQVAAVEADFSLIDFIRDRYVITRLELAQPAFFVRVTETGAVEAGVAPPERVSAQNVFVADAQIRDGTLRVEDQRSDETLVADAISGDVRLEALRGPFSFQGRGMVDGAEYGVRISSGAVDADGVTTLSASLRPIDEGFSLSVEGALETASHPVFAGAVTYRQAPPSGDDGAADDIGRGDLVMTAQIRADSERVVLTDYIVTPDENRAATRLQGAAEITLGAAQRFNAVISGGLLALPPRDATAEQTVEPYELIRLLRELPLPAAPGLPGTIGVDIAELDLRAVSLRDVRLDARAHQGGWTITRFEGQLPGDTTVTLRGEVMRVGDHPEFSGQLAVKSERLDVLSTLWRKPPVGNPLFGMPGQIAARVDLVGETLSLSDGSLMIDGLGRSFSAQVGFGTIRDIHFSADLGSMDDGQSAALFALLPEPGDGRFAASFPAGRFEIYADQITLEDLPARALTANGSWDGGVVVVDELSAGDFGGAGFKAQFTAFGSLETPELSGTATLTIDAPDAPAIDRFFGLLGAPDDFADFARRSLPADIALRLAAPTGTGAQTLALSGRLGTSDVEADAELEAGFLRALNGHLGVKFDVKSGNQSAMMAQLGLPELPLAGGEVPLHLIGEIEGDIASSFTATVLLEGGADSLGFAGDFVVSGREANSGRGNLKVELTEPAALVAHLGLEGLTPPAISGTASISFADGMQSVRLSGIKGSSGDVPFTGNLALDAVSGTPRVTGALDAESMDLTGLIATLAGPAALVPGDGVWPDGPLALGQSARNSTGRIRVTTPTLSAGPAELSAASFDLDWDQTTNRLRAFSAELGQGKVTLDLSLCCAGTLSDKQVTGRATMAGVLLDDILPAPAADSLDGTLDASVRFDGTGGSIAAVFDALTGEGTFDVSGFEIARIDPTAIVALNERDDLVELQPAEVSSAIVDRLDDADFTGASATGGFTIAGGVLRSPNLAIAGQDGRLFGNGQLRLDDLGLGGSYVLTPTASSGSASGEVTARLGGTLFAPELDFDVTRLVDAI